MPTPMDNQSTILHVKFPNSLVDALDAMRVDRLVPTSRPRLILEFVERAYREFQNESADKRMREKLEARRTQLAKRKSSKDMLFATREAQGRCGLCGRSKPCEVHP